MSRIGASWEVRDQWEPCQGRSAPLTRCMRPAYRAPVNQRDGEAVSTPIGVIGFGGYTPERLMTNDDWSQLVDTTDEWITTRTGIHRRRFAADDETTLDLAAAAAEKAMEDAGISAADLDEIIVATDTPEVYTPDTAAFLQDRLGAGEVPAFDLGGSGCAGFVLGMDIARSRIQQTSKKILVVGVELISRLMDWTDRTTAVLFGDGAGAVVMTSGDVVAEVLSVSAGTDGSKAGILTLETGGTRAPGGRSPWRRRRTTVITMS